MRMSPPAPTPAIRLTDIDKFFGPVQANRRASLEVARGEIHALVGENGAGKSTLMRVLSGMYLPDGGRMVVEGRDITGWSTADAIEAGVGMVHQHFMLVPTLTVAENMVLGRELTKGGQLDRERAERDVAVFEMIQRVKDRTFKGGIYTFGLAQDGVRYVYDEHNRALIPDSVHTRLEALKADIIAGKITVPSTR
jgi:ABC-type sugar transport system ATPase subunit